MASSHQTRRSPSESSRPRAIQLYVVGAIFLGLSALYGGISLMRNPRNDPLGMPLEWLDGTPFRDYFVPGLTLFGVFGVGSFAVLYGILFRRPWARIAAIGLGVAQVGWILVEALVLRAVHPLHLLYGGLGATLAGLALRSSVREFLVEREETRA